MSLTEIPQDSNAVKKYLETKTCADIVSTRKYVTDPKIHTHIATELITVATSETVNDAVSRLLDYKISSLPVIHPGQELRGVCVGFIDMLDIATYAVNQLPDLSKVTDPNEKRSIFTKVMGKVSSAPVNEVFNKTWKDLNPLFEERKTTAALEVFKSGTKRVPLFNETHNLVGLCSQFDLVRAIHQHFIGLGEEAEKEADDEKSMYTNMMMKPLSYFGYLEEDAKCDSIQIFPTNTMLEALQKFGSTKAQALAVVSPDSGELVANLSAKDTSASFTRGVTWEGPQGEDVFSKVVHTLLGTLGNLSIEEFLTKHYPSSLQPVCVYSDCSLVNAIAEMVNKKIHQIWIVKKNGTVQTPLRMFTITDVCDIVHNFDQTQSWQVPEEVISGKGSVEEEVELKMEEEA